MELPGVGVKLDRFTIERFEIGHRPIGSSRYEYPVEYELRGQGGVQGVKKALRPFTRRRRSTFSGFGTPYQLKFGGIVVVALGDKRYAAYFTGIGVGFDLVGELRTFSKFIAANHLSIDTDDERERSIDEYIAEYKLDVKRKIRRIGNGGDNA